MAAPKFNVGDRVRVYIDGKVRRGRITDVTTGHKRGERRMYFVNADYHRRPLGTFSSKELTAR